MYENSIRQDNKDKERITLDLKIETENSKYNIFVIKIL